MASTIGIISLSSGTMGEDFVNVSRTSDSILSFYLIR